MHYMAPGYYRCFASVMGAAEGGSNTQVASQFLRAATSCEYVMEKLNIQRTPYSIGSSGYTVNDDGSVVFTAGG